jgi:FHIPEP family/Tetratricopeptide repeat
VADRAEELGEALGWLDRALPLRPSWEGTIRARRGSILRTLERYKEAESELLEALRLEPNDESIWSELGDLADVCFTTDDRFDRSLRLLRQAREIIGEKYEDRYQNQVGNIHYYTGEFDLAIDAYQKAIVAEENPLYLANLARAWEHVSRERKQPEDLANAISAIRRAVDADPTNPEYTEQLAALEMEVGALTLLGDNLLEFSPTNVAAIEVDLTLEALPLVLAGPDELSKETLDQIEELQERFRRDYGVLVPGVQFGTLDDPTVHGAYTVSLMGAQVHGELIELEKRFAPVESDGIVAAGIGVERHQRGLEGYWVEREDWQTAAAAGIPLWTPFEYLFRHLESIILANLDELVGHQEVVWLLEAVEGTDEVTESTARLTALVTVLRAMLREWVPIAPIQAIVHRFLELSDEGENLIAAVERLRSLPELVQRLPGNHDGATIYRLEPTFERELREAIQGAGGDAVLALRRARLEDFTRAVRRVVRKRGTAILAIADPAIRPHVRSVLEPEFPTLHVLSRAELLPGREERSELTIQVPGVNAPAEPAGERA